jgi:hypothetical protein
MFDIILRNGKGLPIPTSHCTALIHSRGTRHMKHESPSFQRSEGTGFVFRTGCKDCIVCLLQGDDLPVESVSVRIHDPSLPYRLRVSIIGSKTACFSVGSPGCSVPIQPVCRPRYVSQPASLRNMYSIASFFLHNDREIKMQTRTPDILPSPIFLVRRILL